MTNIVRTQKVRRKSGRVEPRCLIKAPKKEIINVCLDPQPHWSDWDDHRDGFRAPFDRTKIRPINGCFLDEDEVKRDNDKQKRLLKRRGAMKNSIFERQHTSRTVSLLL